MRKNSILFISSLIACLGLVFITGCKTTNEDGSGNTNEAKQGAELTTAYTASAIVGASDAIITRGPLIIEGSPLQDATYNDQTGWWTISLNLGNGETLDLEIQFQDATGNIQEFFRLTTEKILVKGNGTSSGDSYAIDWVITGLGVANSQWIFNGTGTSSYQGVSSSYTISNLTIAKLQGEYPQSGELAVTSEGVVITISFNGTDTVSGTYQYGGQTVNFTINLDTGQIT